MPIFDSWVSRCIELPNLVTPTRETSPWHDQWRDLSSGVATIGQRCKRGQRVTSATSNFPDLTLAKTKKKIDVEWRVSPNLQGVFFPNTFVPKSADFHMENHSSDFLSQVLTNMALGKFTNFKWETHLYFHMVFFFLGIYVASLTAPGGSKKRQERRKIGPSNSKRSAPAAWEEMVSTAPHRPMIRFRPRRGRKFWWWSELLRYHRIHVLRFYHTPHGPMGCCYSQLSWFMILKNTQTEVIIWIYPQPTMPVTTRNIRKSP